MESALFIRSYYKDLDWLYYCLDSVRRFCSGFHVVVVVPQSSQPWLARRKDLFKAFPFEFCRSYRDDYLGQQVTKLHADQYTGADLIFHVDSDCIFTRPFRPEDGLVDRKPRMLMQKVTRLGYHRPWLRPTEDFLGWPVAYDFMVHPPFVFPRHLYAAIRHYAQEKHGMDLEEYILSRPPRGFSEFNVLGAYAYKNERESFHWEEVDKEQPGQAFCRWYWSWGGLTGEIQAEIEAILPGSYAGQSRGKAR